MPSLSFLVMALAGVLSSLLSFSWAASRQVTDWDENPSKLGTVFVYELAKLAEQPAIILGVGYRHPQASLLYTPLGILTCSS